MSSIKTLLESVIDSSNDESCYSVMTGDILESILQLSEEEVDELLYESDDTVDGGVLDEAAGALAGLPKGTIRSITNYAAKGGENSKVETNPAKAKTAAHVAITAGLNKGHHVVVKKGDKVVASVHPMGYEKKSTVVDASTGEEIKKTVHEYKRRRGSPQSYLHTYQTREHSRAEAINAVHAAVEKHGGYGADVTVHHISPDTNRIEKQEARRKARQTSYAGPHSSHARAERAAQKLADKYTPDSREADDKAREGAEKFHAAIAAHLANGDFHSAHKETKNLQDHIEKHIMAKQNDRYSPRGQAISDIKYNAPDARRSSYSRDRFVAGLKKLKSMANTDK